MSEVVQGFGTAGALNPAERNRVLRNTYILLAISLLPTIGGVMVGMQTGAFRLFTGFLGFAAFMGIAIAFMWGIEKTKNSAKGVAVLLAFTFFMGLVLSGLITRVMGLRNGPSLVMTAFGGTAGVFAVMAILASVIKRDLSGMRNWLVAGALVLIVGIAVNIFMQSSVMAMVISTLVIGVFSLFMLYDLKQIMDGGETNYISATLALYMDIFNVFQGLLSLLGLTSSSD
jgi:modulator of FtsH protease